MDDVALLQTSSITAAKALARQMPLSMPQLELQQREALAAPEDNARSCLVDVTKQYQGRYPCVVKNACDADLSVSCGDNHENIAANQGPHQPRASMLCEKHGGCKVTKQVKDNILYGDCFVDVTGQFDSKEECTVSNNCPEDIVATCGTKHEYVASDLGKYMRVMSVSIGTRS